MSRVHPTKDEAIQLVVGPASHTWQQASDVRRLLLAPYALLLQVAHPTVGAGVLEHSTFASDPWGRLVRTLDYLDLFVYGGTDAIEVASRVRALHKNIKGTKPDGSRYHALEPEAYAWVHATLMLAIVELHRRFIGPLPDSQVEASYQEWLGLGRLLGVREGDLPPDWPGFLRYCDTMVTTTLRNTEAAQLVLETMRKPARPPGWPRILDWLWRGVRIPLGYLLTITGASAMSPELRELFGIRWTARTQRQVRVLAAISRRLTPLLPRHARVSGPMYLRLRRKHIAKDEFAPERYRANAS